MKPKTFFLQADLPVQKRYEALRCFYIEGLSADQAAEKFNFSPAYFKKLRYQFNLAIKKGENPFFQTRKTGPKKRFTDSSVIEQIIALRKQNHSIQDIKTVLEAKQIRISLDAIDKILKSEGFAPLPKRTRRERLSIKVPAKIQAPQSVRLQLDERLSHDSCWNLDRALGFFAGLNVLPKKSTLSSYSYRVKRSCNRKFMLQLSSIFQNSEAEEGEFNLDFKTIPHWGEASVLEKNFSGTRCRSIKSILSLIVQQPSTGYLSYTDAEIRHRNQKEAVLEFVDFWKSGRGEAPKMLIFDSKLTTYEHLSKLNQSQEKIKFLTLRRRGKELIKKVSSLPEGEWQQIEVEGQKRKKRLIRVHDGFCKLRNYKGEVRQVILTDHGREKPSFLISNDFDLDVRQIVKKYARRWLVEQETAEQIAFFHLNQPSSSIVLKVDFDLTLSLLTHNLYRVLSSKLPGFEHCTVSTIYRNFLENGARVKVEGNEVIVSLKKKSHLPILFQLPWLKEKTSLSWWGFNIRFEPAASS